MHVRFTLAILALSASSALAQVQVTLGSRVPNARMQRFAPTNLPGTAAIIDTTLDYSSLAAGLPCGQDTGLTYYTLTNGGFASGTNPLGLKEFGQKFRLPGNFKVVSALVPTVVRDHTNPDVFVNAYAATRRRVGTAVFVDTATRKQSDPMPLSLVQSGRFNEFFFSDTTTYRDSVILTTTIPPSTDTLIVFTTNVGCVANPANVDSYVLWNGQRGLRVLNTVITNFTVDVAMSAVVEYDDVAVGTSAILAAATRVYPVPATNSVMVVVPNNLRGQSPWQLHSADGRIVRQGKMDGVAASLDCDGLTGVYFLRINSTAGPIVKQVVFAD